MGVLNHVLHTKILINRNNKLTKIPFYSNRVFGKVIFIALLYIGLLNSSATDVIISTHKWLYRRALKLTRNIWIFYCLMLLQLCVHKRVRYLNIILTEKPDFLLTPFRVFSILYSYCWMARYTWNSTYSFDLSLQWELLASVHTTELKLYD